jgi:hypothetical protein
MYGWQARPCMNLHGMYSWFGVVPQGCVVLFPSFFVVIFGALGCDFFDGGPCASLAGDFAPKSPLNRTRFGGFSSCWSSCPREPKSSIPLDCVRFESIPLR